MIFSTQPLSKMRLSTTLILLTSILLFRCVEEEMKPISNSDAQRIQNEHIALGKELDGTVDYRISSMTADKPINSYGQSYDTDFFAAQRFTSCALDDSLLVQFVDEVTILSDSIFNNSRLNLTRIAGTRTKCSSSNPGISDKLQLLPEKMIILNSKS